MLATAMALGDRPGDDGAYIASWRQMVDVLAQAGPELRSSLRLAAVEQLVAARGGVPAHERRMTAASLAGRTRDMDVVMLFATDVPVVAAPLLARLELDNDGWRAAIPALPPASRNILRNRRDLPGAATELLARFASGDLALPASDGAAEAASSSVTQIRDLVDRIEAYRRRMPQGVPPEDESGDLSTGFEFETTTDGIIDWIDGAPREALVGLTIGDMAEIGCAGVDGQAAGAWRRRAPFRDARLLVDGVGATGGDWLISGAPLFNPRDGRFCGYRGTARRPETGERAGGASATAGIAPDSLRQLVHELRTPLNAIQGFAQMIDQQLLGPVAFGYRQRARAIVADTDRLTTLVDDLDTNARIDGGQMEADEAGQADVAAIAQTIVTEHRAVLSGRAVELHFADAAQPAVARAASKPVERMLARLISAASGVATPGETIDVAIAPSPRGIVFSVSRPISLAGRDERALLDPAYGPEGDWPDAPLLGLGFTLRLVARLAVQAGGSLKIRSERFELILPDVAATIDEKTGGPGRT